MTARTTKGLTSFFASWAFALFLLVLGARLWVFSYAGSPLPLYDQWIAEFNNLFLQAAGGGGIVETLLTPHNEHLQLSTKLVSLGGFVANGYWDVPFLAAASAFVRAAEAAVLFGLITQGASSRGKFCLWGLCAAIFAAPLSGYNLLCGLQISFYFAGLALLWSVWL